jgi:transcription termination/antitermination protein NusG
VEWFVVQVLAGQEKKVKKSLEELRLQEGLVESIQEILLPTENVSEVKGGEQKITEKRIWPGYLLLRMELTDDTWAYVKGTNGVIGFLGGEKPVSLAESEVQEILSDVADRKERVTQKHQVAVGDNVKITEGVFVNFVGTVTEMFPDKGRLNVLVAIFGRETLVEDLEVWQVEKVSEDDDELS